MNPFDIVQLRRPPHGYGVTHSGGAADAAAIQHLTTINALSSAQMRVLVATDKRSYVLCRFETLGTVPDDPRTVIGYVSFGPAGMSDAGNSDFPVTHAEVWEWCCIAPIDSYMKLLRATSDNIRCRFYVTDEQE